MTIYSETDIGFVYVWIHRSSGKYYIGSHKGTPDDGYVGSGHAFKRAVKKYGIESFERTIDYMGPNFKQEETDLIGFFEACTCPLGYNLRHFEKGMISDETRQKVAKALTGKPKSPEHRAKMLEIVKNKSPETREKHRKLALKNLQTPESIAKAADSKRGKKLSKEHCRKISMGNMGHIVSEETCRKISESRTGQIMPPMTDEHRKNLSEAQKKRRERERVEGIKPTPRSEEAKANMAAAQRKRWARKRNDDPDK